MIADAPVAAAAQCSPWPMARAEVFLRAAREAAADGLTWSEFGELLVALMRTLISACDTVTSLDGAAKKALVLESAGQLFDLLADLCVPIVAWPFWMMCRPFARLLVISLSSGAVEQLLKMTRGN